MDDASQRWLGVRQHLWAALCLIATPACAPDPSPSTNASEDSSDTEPQPSGDDSTDDCSTYIGLGNQRDFASSPRANWFAETIAIDLYDDLTASDEDYEAIAADIEAVTSEMDEILTEFDTGSEGPPGAFEFRRYRSVNATKGVFLDVSEALGEAVREAEREDSTHPLRCINDWYGIDIRLGDSTRELELQSEHIFNLELLSQEYKAIEGVEELRQNHRFDDWTGDGSSICAQLEDGSIRYLVGFAWGDCPSGCVERHDFLFEAADDGLALVDSATANESPWLEEMCHF